MSAIQWDNNNQRKKPKPGSSAQEKCGATVEIQTLITDRKRWSWLLSTQGQKLKIMQLQRSKSTTVIPATLVNYKRMRWLFAHKLVQQVCPQVCALVWSCCCLNISCYNAKSCCCWSMLACRRFTSKSCCSFFQLGLLVLSLFPLLRTGITWSHCHFSRSFFFFLSLFPT